MQKTQLTDIRFLPKNAAPFGLEIMVGKETKSTSMKRRILRVMHFNKNINPTVFVIRPIQGDSVLAFTFMLG